MHRIQLSLLLVLACGSSALACSSGAGSNGSGGSGGSGGASAAGGAPPAGSYHVVGTQQSACYSTNGSVIDCPSLESEPLFGQDAQSPGLAAAYTGPGDGTVVDGNTGLVWEKEPHISTFASAAQGCASATTGGHADWRVPTIKELYSLIDFTGQTGTADPTSTTVPSDAIPYIDTDAFTFHYGSEVDLGSAGGTGNRYIDAQHISSTAYVGKVMSGVTAFFGVNFADGRIKGYPQDGARSWFLRCVRGGSYGVNDFVDNGDGTIADQATGLVWMQKDSGGLAAGNSGDGKVDWAGALAFCEGLDYAGHTDWRLPDAKELQSLVDYTRSPDTTASAAIDPLFEATSIVNEGGQTDYGYYWTSTTHLDGKVMGTDAIYVAFGRALGFFTNQYLDVHGAGAQRSDPKAAGGAGSVGCGNGPQGDCRRTYNFARCVRGGASEP